MDVTFPFEDEGEGNFGRILRPTAKVTFQIPNSDKLVDVWMVVDTGADYTILPRHLSKKLRINLNYDCQRSMTFGVGGEQIVFFYKKRLEVSIGPLTRHIPLAFINRNDVPPLLGRLGFLETFNTEFLKTHIVVFKD